MRAGTVPALAVGGGRGMAAESVGAGEHGIMARGGGPALLCKSREEPQPACSAGQVGGMMGGARAVANWKETG